MKSPIIAAVLLILSGPAVASPRAPTPAQWRDIHTLTNAFGRCTPELKEACKLSEALQIKLGKQGFCFHKRLIVGRLAWDGPEKDRVQLWPKGVKQCYILHDPSQ